MAVSAIDLITRALRELNIVAAGETPEHEDEAQAFAILNRDIMDRWNAIKPFATHKVITSGTFAVSAATVTVGPTGTYVLTPRPEEILQAHWVDSSDFRNPIMIRDADWYASQSDPTRSESVISDIAYFASAPNGTMYPWPIPDANTTVEIETRSVLSRFANLTATADLAPGYESAIHYTLKELYCKAWDKPLTLDIMEDARMARSTVMGLHRIVPRIDTRPY